MRFGEVQILIRFEKLIRGKEAAVAFCYAVTERVPLSRRVVSRTIALPYYLLPSRCDAFLRIDGEDEMIETPDGQEQENYAQNNRNIAS